MTVNHRVTQEVWSHYQRKGALDATFATNLLAAAGTQGEDVLTDGDDRTALTVPPGEWVVRELSAPVTFDVIMLQENIRRGQRIEAFSIEARQEGHWRPLVSGTTVGYKRLLRVPSTTADGIRLRVDSALAPACLGSLGLFQRPDLP